MCPQNLRIDMLKQASLVLQSLKDFLGENFVDAFLFGSVAKGLVNEDSDVDIICIGSQEKSCNLIINLNSYVSKVSDKYETNIIYYEKSKFKKLYNNGNLFLHSIKFDLMRESDINELL